MNTLLDELVDAVKAGMVMRQAQKNYFKFRDREMLVASKQQEKEFDTKAAAVIAKMEGEQS